MDDYNRTAPRLAAQLPDAIATDPRKMQAAIILAEGGRLDRSWEEIAKEAGITRRTLQDWRKMQDFQEAVLILARESIRDSLPVAFRTLEDCLRSGDTRSRLRACELILRCMGELVERVESTTTITGDAASILASLDLEIASMERGQVEI